MSKILLLPIERFLKKVNKTKTCWLWTGSVDGKGYGCFRVNGVLVKCHRWIYEYYVAMIPPDMTVHHKCYTRHCVNPAHLLVLSNKDNILDGSGICAKNKRKIYCKRRHKFSLENTYRRPDGGRECKICRYRHRRKHYLEKGS